MPEIKPHLKNLYRSKTSDFSRRQYLRLDMNESIQGLPESFVKDTLSSIDSSFLATYPEYNNLLKKVAAHNGLEPENICLSNGSDSAIKYIFDAYVSPGDRVLVTDPTFAMYPVYTAMFNAECVTVEYNRDMTFPTEKFLDRISPRIKLTVLVNPNNPTGSVLTHGEMIEIIEKAASNDVLVIVDEAYFYFYPETMIPYIKSYNNLVVLRTFSKLCGIAAARLGYAAASPNIIEGIKKVRPTFDVNAIAVLFAEKVLDSPQIIQDLIKDTNEGKKYLVEKLSEKNIACIQGHANFILIKCNGRAKEIMAGLKEKDILVSGEFRQEYLSDYIRVTIASKDYMEKFLETFAAIWDA